LQENKQKQKIKTKKQRYREKRRQRGNSSENVLSPIDPNTLIALKSYIKFVDEQIDQTTVCKVNVMDDEVEDQKVDQNVVSDIIINETTTIEDIQSIEETKNNVIVHEIEEIQSNITTTINEKVETDDVKLTSQLNNSLSNGLLIFFKQLPFYQQQEFHSVFTDKYHELKEIHGGGNGNITQNSNIQRVRNKEDQLNALFESVRDIVLQNSPRFFFTILQQVTMILSLNVTPETCEHIENLIDQYETILREFLPDSEAPTRPNTPT
jgi:hypothetical protein